MLVQPKDNPTLVNLTSPTIPTAAECAAACCASPKVPNCTYAAFGTGECWGGDYMKSPVCRKRGDKAYQT